MYLMVLEVLEGLGLSAVKIIRKIITIISILKLLSMPFGMLKDDPPEPQPTNLNFLAMPNSLLRFGSSVHVYSFSRTIGSP